MTGETQPAKMSVMHVEVPMQAGKPAQSTSGRSHHTHKAPTVVHVVEQEPKVTVDVTVPASGKAPTVVRSERPKPPIVRQLPARAASVHTVIEPETISNAYAEIVVDERSEHAPGTRDGTTVIVETHPVAGPAEEKVVEVVPARVEPPTATVIDLETRSIAPSHHSQHENALGLTSTSEMPFQIPRLSHRSHSGHHGGHHRRSLHATVKIPMQLGQPAMAMAKAESPSHAAVAEIGPASVAQEVIVEAPQAETVVVAPGITARASITNSPPRAPTVVVTPPTAVDAGKGKGKKKKKKGGSVVPGETVVVEATARTDATVVASDYMAPQTVAQTVVSAPRPIIQVVEMPRGISTYPQHYSHRHTHRFPHPPSSASSVPAGVGPPVFSRTEKTPAPPSVRGSPHMHTFVHHTGQTEHITVLPDETEVIRESRGSPAKGSKKKLSSASDKGCADPAPPGVTASHPAPGVTRIEVRPVLQNSLPVYTERVMMRGPDAGIDPHPAGRRFSDLRPIPIIDYRSFLLSPPAPIAPLPQIVNPAPGPPTVLQSQHDYLDDAHPDRTRTSRSSHKGHHRRHSDHVESKMTSTGENQHKDKDHPDDHEDYYHRMNRKDGNGRHRRRSQDRHRHHRDHHHHTTDPSSVVPTPRHDHSSRSTHPTGHDHGSHHHHHHRHHFHHRRSDDESIPVYRSTPEMTPPADRFAKYAYPPSYEKIKEREEKLSKMEAEKAAAKAAKGMPFPPGGYLAMGNQMYTRPPPLGLGMYGGGMMPGMGMGMMRPPFGMPSGRGFF